MAVYLISREPKGRTLVHSQAEHAAGLAIGSEENSSGIVLCTKEYADEQFLMHYRVGGEVNGRRRWQNADGSYTAAGRQHYAEMYGWGKFRANRAEKKATKYQSKASKAEEELHKQQVKVDKARVKTDKAQKKLDRFNKKHASSTAPGTTPPPGTPATPTTVTSKQSKAVDKNALKLQKENNRLHEAQLKFDKLRNKAEKYQEKTDRLHDKWDEQTKKLEEKADKALEKGDVEKAAAYEKELQRRGIMPDTSKDLTAEKVATEVLKKMKESDDAAKADREAEERVESNRYVEGSRAFRENAENEQRMQNFDNLSAEDKRKTGDYLIQKMSDYQKTYVDKKDEDLDDLDADVAKHAHYEYRNDEQWLMQRMDKDSGNENTGYYKPGSNGEKAHNVLEESYAKSSARTEELIREHKLDRSKVYTDSKEYAKLREVVESDKLWKTLNAQDKKNEQDLLGAVLKDLGFSNTQEARDIISWYVFLD